MARKTKTYVEHDIWKNPEIDEIVFEIPGENITGNLKHPDQKLAEAFQGYKRRSTENLVSMALLANATRIANITIDGDYTKEFNVWYTKYNMEKIFGKRSNFSKYADAGFVLNYFKDKLKKQIDILPLNISALGAVKKFTEEEVKLAIEDHWIKDPKKNYEIRRKDKRPSPVINPEATKTSILTWLDKWRNPPVLSTEKRRLPFFTVKAHGSVYDFDSTGTFKGTTTIADLERIDKKIQNAIKGEEAHILYNSSFTYIKEGQEKRRLKILDSKASKSKRK